MASKGKKEGGPTKRTYRSKFPELPPKYSISRDLRNKAEKMRRDRLNKYIEEMRSLVPVICDRPKKSQITKTNILRLTTNFLRIQSVFNHPRPSPTPTTFLEEGLSHLESMGGFLFMLLEDGRILYVSENVTKFLGYSQIDMMGLPIFDFAHPSDKAKLHSNLSRKKNKLRDISVSNSPSSSSFSPSSSSFSPSSSFTSPEGAEEPKIFGSRQSFYIRLREKPLAKNDTPHYEHMHLVGQYKRSPGSLALDERRRAKLGEDMVMDDGEYVFVGMMRTVRDRPITELSLMEAIQDQYITRHLPDGRIIYSDHRISTIAGYLPAEVVGKSAFNFIFGEDLPWTTMAQRHMFASSNGEGDTTYRLRARSGEFVCLQSRGFLEYSKASNKVESFMCINTLIRPEHVDRYLTEQKERFTPYITEFQRNAFNRGSSDVMAKYPPPMLNFFSSLSTLKPTSPTSPTSPNVKIAPPSPTEDTRSYIKMEEGNSALEEQDTLEEQNYNHSFQKQSQRLSGEKRKLAPGCEMYDKTCKSVRLSPAENQYMSRTGPVHRLSDGNRVMDVQDVSSQTGTATNIASKGLYDQIVSLLRENSQLYSDTEDNSTKFSSEEGNSWNKEENGLPKLSQQESIQPHRDDLLQNTRRVQSVIKSVSTKSPMDCGKNTLRHNVVKTLEECDRAEKTDENVSYLDEQSKNLPKLELSLDDFENNHKSTFIESSFGRDAPEMKKETAKNVLNTNNTIISTNGETFKSVPRQDYTEIFPENYNPNKDTESNHQKEDSNDHGPNILAITQPSPNILDITQTSSNNLKITQPRNNLATSQYHFNNAPITQPTFNSITITQPPLNNLATTQPPFNNHIITQPTPNNSSVTEPLFYNSAVTENSFYNSGITEPPFCTSSVTEPSSNIIVSYSNQVDFENPGATTRTIGHEVMTDMRAVHDAIAEVFIVDQSL